MGAEISNYSAFPSDEFALLLFSHIKLCNIDKIDVVELNCVLTDLYYEDNEYKYILQGLKLRETDTNKLKHDKILDIETVLMNAYLLGYVNEKSKEIMLSKEYIEQFIISHYDKHLNNTFKHISKRYVEAIKNKNSEKLSTRSFMGDLFKKYNNFVRKRITKKDGDIE